MQTASTCVAQIANLGSPGFAGKLQLRPLVRKKGMLQELLLRLLLIRVLKMEGIAGSPSIAVLQGMLTAAMTTRLVQALPVLLVVVGAAGTVLEAGTVLVAGVVVVAGVAGAVAGAGLEAVSNAAAAPANFAPNDGAPVERHFWSLTIGANGRHVPSGWLEIFKTYSAAHDMKGAASLERGGKKGILHTGGCSVHCALHS